MNELIVETGGKQVVVRLRRPLRSQTRWEGPPRVVVVFEDESRHGPDSTWNPSGSMVVEYRENGEAHAEVDITEGLRSFTTDTYR